MRPTWSRGRPCHDDIFIFFCQNYREYKKWHIEKFEPEVKSAYPVTWRAVLAISCRCACHFNIFFRPSSNFSSRYFENARASPAVGDAKIPVPVSEPPGPSQILRNWILKKENVELLLLSAALFPDTGDMGCASRTHQITRTHRMHPHHLDL